MIELNIQFPSIYHKNYIEKMYKYCRENQLSMILKGSLLKGTATKFSDIDLVILGKISEQQADELITLYGEPIMTNYTENPKGILILLYKDTISVDLDIRETVSSYELKNSKILLRFDKNININNDEDIRKIISSKYIQSRPEWYKTLRLVHRGLIKYLSDKTDNAYGLLSEIKDKLNDLGIENVKYVNDFGIDIQSVFGEMCNRYDVDSNIITLFETLFKNFKNT